ncbi:mannitol dehydrogenase family protein [Vagococcus fessus]|uniref:Mannitol dehydrogenase n=1 Tax=Vagococcus fessus TaxID=120370 RepID=A0A430AD83_9ENTE|nr:mannitol dehydrogenase family protein [Vagococcus fessus]RSU05153.1 mannitol dehydrogenase [Vagococcus fessus]
MKNNKNSESSIFYPEYDISGMRSKTKEAPTWVHFGGGNLFRAFHAEIADDLLVKGLTDKGVVVAETYDEEVIENIYHQYDNKILQVIMKSNGALDKRLISSVSESYYLAPDTTGQKELRTIFESETLQLVTFSITEKAYKLSDMKGKFFPFVEKDLNNLPEKAEHTISQLVYLILTRFYKNGKPLALVSTDNFSRNGQILEDSVLTIANKWLDNGYVPKEFLEYINSSISFPWTMIDRITPNPSETVEELLKESASDFVGILHSKKHTNIAPFVNTEETHYLVIEDDFPNGRPRFEEVGVILTDRETVDKVDAMKVTTCLNPLHTTLAIFGCLLGYDSISDEMKDSDLRELVKKIGYSEGLPVVVNPGIINPKEFIDEVIETRLPNKYIPDTPQRIATDTSQKMAIRFGETLNKYNSSEKLDVSDLEYIPLTIAAWCRYLMGVNDEGQIFEPSPDPMLTFLNEELSDLKLGDSLSEESELRVILENESIFGCDCYAIGLGKKIEMYFNKMISGTGSVRNTLQELLQSEGEK